MSNVLLVDDELTQLTLNRMGLTRSGDQVVSVRSGEEAVAQYEKKQFDVVIVDMYMKPNELDGVLTLEKLIEIENSEKRRPAVKILYTASPEGLTPAQWEWLNQHGVEVLPKGAVGILMKAIARLVELAAEPKIN